MFKKKAIADLEKIIEDMKKLVESLDVRITQLETESGIVEGLPDHLRKTILALRQIGGRGTADDVAFLTQRARAVESGYLNQLVNMKRLGKERVGRHVHFYVVIK